MERCSLEVSVLGNMNTVIRVLATGEVSIEDMQKSTRRLAWVLVQCLPLMEVINLVEEVQRAIRLEAVSTLIDEAESRGVELIMKTEKDSPSISYHFVEGVESMEEVDDESLDYEVEDLDDLDEEEEH